MPTSAYPLWTDKSPKSLVVAFALFAFSDAFAKKAPGSMKEFNKQCPTPALCKDLYKLMDECQSGIKKSCDGFVSSYRKALPEYDCQRSFDNTPTDKYIVPAIWLCEDTHERFLEFLSKMKTSEGTKLFGSQELRNSLDGALAEEYAPKSLVAAKRAKK